MRRQCCWIVSAVCLLPVTCGCDATTSVVGDDSPAAVDQPLDGQPLDGQALDGQALDGQAEGHDGDGQQKGGRGRDDDRTGPEQPEEPAETRPEEKIPPTGAADQPRRANRLAGETSPYLLMHAHNPVDWYPWGEEALRKAKAENKLIFLSIGYSSCHWCHVMERESFMDDEIARLMNEHFVCVKVDREERPDIDKIYMTALNLLGNNGGWPMSMFLTPDAKPIWGGTYFPARDGDRGVRAGFLTILRSLNELWTNKKQDVDQAAEALTAETKRVLERQVPSDPRPVAGALVEDGVRGLSGQFDTAHGGFGYTELDPRRPKFPEPSNIYFLLHVHDTTKSRGDPDQTALDMAVATLTRMAMGGIRDHLGGGFHRYSVDRFWRIPHFEKMLYDNGQLVSVYARAYAITGREEFRRVVDETLAYVLREMRDEGGAFYSALDAESEHEEGKFYRWEKDQVREILGDDDFELFAQVYGLDGPPNFEESYYVPQLTRTIEQHAESMNLTYDRLQARLEPMRRKLFEARSSRPRPLTDTKVLTSWNGLMIRGLADAGRILENEQYVAEASRAADFVLANLRDDDGRLLRTYSQGNAKLNAYLDDYAFLIDGLIALHEATGQQKWLTAADRLAAAQIESFADDRFGGFFFTSDNHESLLARAKNPIDGALPSGISVSAENLLYLADATEKQEYVDSARRAIQSVAPLLESSPVAAPRMLVSVSKLLARQPQEDSPPSDARQEGSDGDTDGDSQDEAPASQDETSDETSDEKDEVGTPTDRPDEPNVEQGGAGPDGAQEKENG